MQLSDLDEHELRVFMGLFKLVVHADRTVTEEEHAVITELSEQIGVADWNAAVQRAQEAYDTVEQLESDAVRVGRREAQRLIHELLSRLAHADELVAAEAHVLRWVARTWRVAEGEDDDIDEFVLIEDPS